MDSVRIEIPELETSRLRLRRLTLDDADAMHAYASDPKVAALTTWDAHGSIDETRAFLRSAQQMYGLAVGGPWGIVVRDEGRLIGTIGLQHTPYARRADLGYAIARDQWGRGITVEAACAVLDWAFVATDLNRIQAWCAVENRASERVMQKLGMTHEGTLRQYVWLKGRAWDVQLYRMLREGWARRVMQWQGSWSTAPCPAASPAPDRRQRLPQRGDDPVDLGVADDERGEQPDDEAAGGEREDAALLQAPKDRGHAHAELDAGHQATATHRADLRASQRLDAGA